MDFVLLSYSAADSQSRSSLECHPDDEQSTPSSGVDWEEEGPLQHASVASADCDFSANAHGWRALLPAILFYPSQKVPSASSGQALRPLRGTQDDTNEKLFRNLSFVAELTNSFRILSFLFLWPCFRSARNAQTPAPVPA